MRLHTTFALLKKNGARAEKYRKLARSLGGIKKYGKEKPIPIARIIDTNGLDDALWSLRASLPEEEEARDKLARLFACWCFRRAWSLLADSRGKRAVEVAEKYAIGEATKKDLTIAWDSAWDSASAAARGAAWDSAYAAADAATWVAASYAARDTAKDETWATERKKQAAKLREMLEAEQ